MGALGAPEGSEAASFPSTKEAAAGVQQLCRKAATTAVAGFESDVQRRGMLGQGPLAAIDNAELRAWQQLLCVRLEARTRTTSLFPFSITIWAVSLLFSMQQRERLPRTRT